MRSVTRTAYLVVAVLLVAGLVTQVFLAGLGVFKGPASFATHRDFGYTLELLPFILFVLALLGRMGRRAVALPAAIFGLFILQSVFVVLRSDAPEVAALHPVNGFLITFLAIVVARDAWLARNATSTEQLAPAEAT
jgi:hypothetical protein